VFAVCVKYLPIFQHEVAYQPITEPEALQVEVPELSNVEY